MNKKLMICYNTDASRLIGENNKVIFPKEIEEIKKVMRSVNLSIVPRGAGTNVVGSCVPDNAVIIDVGKMNKVSDFNASKQTVRAQAGITLKELNDKLSAVGFEFPIETLNKGISTIGGMIARNEHGIRALKYGTIKDWLEQIEFVNARGELLKIGKADLMDVCGMEGITGVIVSATLKIIPKVERSASIFQTDNLDEVLSVARRLKLEKEVTMLELFPPKVSKLLGFSEQYHIIIEFDSDRGKIKGKEYDTILKLKDKVYHALYSHGYFNSEDYRFFFDKLPDFILHLKENQIPYFGFLGIGIIHPFFKDDDEKREGVIKFVSKIKAKPGSYGIGLLRKYLLDAFEVKIIKRVKLRHDPFGKLNKNKMIEEVSQKDMYKPQKEEELKLEHLKPLKKQEIEEIKPIFKEEKLEEIQPLLGEEISADEIEKQKKRSPGEEMDEFIEKAELIDKIDEKKELGGDIRETLKDYEQTYESELPEKRRKKIEEFAKNVAHDIVHLAEPKIEESEEKDESEIEKRGKLTKEEQDEINKVMFGG